MTPVLGSHLLFNHPAFSIDISQETATATWILSVSASLCNANPGIFHRLWKGLLNSLCFQEGAIPLITQTRGLTFCALVLPDTSFFGFQSKTSIIADVQGIAGVPGLLECPTVTLNNSLLLKESLSALRDPFLRSFQPFFFLLMSEKKLN